MQHPQKHLGAGLHGRGVQRRHAQGLDQFARDGRADSGAELRHGEPGLAGEAGAAPARGRAQQRQPFTPGPVSGAQQAGQQVQRRRGIGQAQAMSVRVVQRQGLAVQLAVHIDADEPQQPQAFGIGADQDMLPVVQPGIAPVGQLHVQAAGASARCPRGLVEGDAVAGLHAFDGRGQPGPARSNDGDVHTRPRACTRQASQNLRSGVSAMRWCSTAKPSRSISRSSVR